MNNAIDPFENQDTCALCGNPCPSGIAFAHHYIKGRRFSICCPACFVRFEQALDRVVSEERLQRHAGTPIAGMNLNQV
jgi:hypothetical protein